MKLEQKFEVVEPNHVNYLEGLVEVADEYAIDFAKWCFKNFDMTTTIDELLEIYKKEKQL
jgi:hypothetical protein